MEIKFSKIDLIRFGNYLLSEERKRDIPLEFQGQVNESEIQEFIRIFADIPQDDITITNKN